MSGDNEEHILRELERLNQKVDKIYDILRGQNGNIGLIARVGKIEETMGNYNRIIWITVAPILTALGLGLIWLIGQAVQ